MMMTKVRKASESDKSYFTIEVQNNRIIQVHGKNNRSPSEDVTEFIEVFKSEKLDKKETKVRIKTPA